MRELDASGVLWSTSISQGVRGIEFMDARIVLLPGDGIGPEIIAQARRVLEVIAKRFGHRFEMPEHAIGGNAIDAGVAAGIMFLARRGSRRTREHRDRIKVSQGARSGLSGHLRVRRRMMRGVTLILPRRSRPCPPTQAPSLWVRAWMRWGPRWARMHDAAAPPRAATPAAGSRRARAPAASDGGDGWRA